VGSKIEAKFSTFSLFAKNRGGLVEMFLRLFVPQFGSVYFLPGCNRRFRHIKCGCLKNPLKHLASGKALPAAKLYNYLL